MESKSSLAGVTVHPHVRGDNNGKQVILGWRNGSPPRAWGQQKAVDNLEEEFRFTPTCVGTTTPTLTTDLTDIGSPPRAWGQHFH